MEKEFKHLKGKVKNFTETESRIPLILNSSIVSTTYHFNKKGQLTDKNTVEQRRRTTSSFSRNLIKYNEDGNIIEQSNGEESDRFYSKTVYTYNKFKQRKSIIELNLAGEIIQERKFKYLNDHSNILDTITTINENGKHIMDFKKIRANIQKNSDTNTNDKKIAVKSDVLIREEYEYDEIGNWIRKTVFENDKKTLKYERSYTYQ